MGSDQHAQQAGSSSFADLQRTLSSPPEYSRSYIIEDDVSESGSDALNSVIPETHDSRTLVLCFDGTGDQFDDDNSNVVQLFSMLKKDDWRQQLVYYQSGIGTYNIPQVARPWMAKLERVVDSMVGMNLHVHVMTGYEFIMQNYQSGDKICLFGFSRGAYTARALAGMIHKVGLLPRYNHQQVPFAYKMYSREDARGWKQASAFKKAFSIDVDVEFLGVCLTLDTVSSVGFIPRRLPFTTSNTSVRFFRHALALDEHRARFVPNFWHRTTKKEEDMLWGTGMRKGWMPKSHTVGRKRAHTVHKPESGVHLHVREVKARMEDASGGDGAGAGAGAGAAAGAEGDVGETVDGGEGKGTANGKKRKIDVHPSDSTAMMQQMEQLYNTGNHGSDVQEVWFAGCHCGVFISKKVLSGTSFICLCQSVIMGHGLFVLLLSCILFFPQLAARLFIGQPMHHFGLLSTFLLSHSLPYNHISLLFILTNLLLFRRWRRRRPQRNTQLPLSHPLRWMIRQCFLTGTGIMFHREMLKDVGLDPDSLYPMVRPRPPMRMTRRQLGAGDDTGAGTAGSSSNPTNTTNITRTQRLRSIFLEDFIDEEEEDVKDILSDIHDELKTVKAWWLLEVLPQKVKYQDENDKWVERIA
ncbi:hypothetical protein D9758_018002 [Tetrapyrgos nigripes]|uniref:T6SS Phospholipase effector Tle1-like catalytic domain-containing protein n=1 Tax=Tetrapyrgos nigripes TaxID=182062 RepID=A0A8H5F9E1_9AGAR|nr:hypothetical protein D9758_018002 [Tetrapyrgos nigripes]